MDISTDTLRSALGQAFDAGYSNSAELRDQLIQEIIEGMQSKKDEQYRVYKVEELRQMPVGAVFHHCTRGRCWIEAKQDGSKHMKFESNKTVSFTSDAEPWDRPMRLLHKEA